MRRRFFLRGLLSFAAPVALLTDGMVRVVNQAGKTFPWAGGFVKLANHPVDAKTVQVWEMEDHGGVWMVQQQARVAHVLVDGMTTAVALIAKGVPPDMAWGLAQAPATAQAAVIMAQLPPK